MTDVGVQDEGIGGGVSWRGGVRGTVARCGRRGGCGVMLRLPAHLKT